MTKLKVDKHENDFLNETITHWEKGGLLNADKAAELRSTLEVKGFDWMRLAKYSFWVALICGVVAVGSLIVDDAVINWLKSLYDTPDIVIAILSAAAAVGLFYLGRKREKLYPEKIFSNEAVIFPVYSPPPVV